MLFNDKKFPPMLPRKLRVTRAKKLSKTALRSEKNTRLKKAGPGTSRTQEESSLTGRAQRLFGRAGAAQKREKRQKPDAVQTIKKPEAFVFEGHRAKAATDKISVKPPKSKKKSTASNPRKTKRSAAFKAGKVGKRRG